MQSSPLPYTAAAAAMNLSPVALHNNKAPAPGEQCEALNLGKKNAHQTNNNNAGENDAEEPPAAKRIKTERSPPPPPPPSISPAATRTAAVQQVAANSDPGTPKTSPNAVPAVATPAACSPVRDPNSPRPTDDDVVDVTDDGAIEMDIEVSAGKSTRMMSIFNFFLTFVLTHSLVTNLFQFKKYKTLFTVLETNVFFFFFSTNLKFTITHKKRIESAVIDLVLIAIFK